MTLEEFKTLKPGDKVKIIDSPIWGRKYSESSQMDQWRGKIVTVRDIQTTNDGMYTFARMEDDICDIPGGWSWFPWMIDKKVPGVITMEIPEDNGKIVTETELKIIFLKREFAEFREQIKDELTRLKSRIFDYMDKK